jgi:hypothetical protein
LIVRHPIVRLRTMSSHHLVQNLGSDEIFRPRDGMEPGTAALRKRYLSAHEECAMRAMLRVAGFAVALILAGCGTNQGDRLASGALIGGAGGAAIGAMAGNPAMGALAGGLVGGVVGAATDPCSVNLGNPIWRNQSSDDYWRRCGHAPPR